MHPTFIRRRKVDKSDGSAAFRVEIDGPDDGRYWQITRFACEDETSTLTGDLRVAIVTAGYDHYLESQELAAGGRLYWASDPTWLFPGEKLAAVFNGSTNNDVLALYIEGWEFVIEPTELEVV